MRLWHWKLVPVLPRDQLLGQWRECCLIMKNISENGTPNHLLVNPIMDYPLDHFYCYAAMVHEEMQRRGYHSDWLKFNQCYFRTGIHTNIWCSASRIWKKNMTAVVFPMQSGILLRVFRN